MYAACTVCMCFSCFVFNNLTCNNINECGTYFCFVIIMLFIFVGVCLDRNPYPLHLLSANVLTNNLNCFLLSVVLVRVAGGAGACPSCHVGERYTPDRSLHKLMLWNSLF